ncbi:MAG: gamma-glutamyltransferase, partial [Herminiimonas sp.]|nr:gamma-glutamyltransferase [Herminiimonas sp.]
MLSFDTQHFPYPSRRTPVYSRRGMVATSQPLAAQAGLEVLQAGGNAIDAAVATAAALTVLEPTANGIGGDAFALVWHGGKLHGLNASGPAAAASTRESMVALGHTEMPKYGPLAVTVPGTPAAWAALSSRFGRLPLTTSMAPAIGYAREGFPVSPSVAYAWQQATKLFRTALTAPHFASWFDTFAPGEAPQAGQLWGSPGHADTLEAIAADGAAGFYRGALAEKIASFVGAAGGHLTAADMAAFQVDWVDPISINYRGFDVWEIPPNGHGVVALIALNILKGFEFGERDTV